MLTTKLLLLGLSLTLSGCQTTPQTSAQHPLGEASAVPVEASAWMSPFSSAQIREAHPDGTTVLTRTQAVGMPTRIHSSSFTEGTLEQVTITTVEQDQAGEPTGEPERTTVTWEELRQVPTALPGYITTVEHRKLTTPMGAHRCTVYIHANPSAPDKKEVYWYADDLPGPPVLAGTETPWGSVATTVIIERRVPPRP